MHSRHRRDFEKPTGLTLVGILIVIAILVVLPAITVPLVGRMKSKAQSTECVSNLRQLVTIATMEASETGFYPPMLSQSTNSNGALAHNGNHFYSLTEDMTCVSCPAAKYTGYDSKNKPVTAYGGNPMVMVFYRDGNPPLVRPSQIDRPSEVLLMGDSAQHGPPNQRSLGWFARWYGSRTGKPEDADKPLTTAEIPASGFWDPDVATLPLRHDGHANVAFCDGHVISIGSISELKQKNLYWN